MTAGDVALKGHSTHEVVNQASPLENYNLFTSDQALVEAIKREGADWSFDRLVEMGGRLGSPDAIKWGVRANEHVPVLQTHDRFGHRIEEIEFDDAWHELMRITYGYGAHNLPWREERPGSHVARAAMLFLSAQNEAGHACPISMTFSAVPTLRKQVDVADVWLPHLKSCHYDPRYAPISAKKGILIGMAMTEKQGGSDVRANTTTATPVSKPGPGQLYSITGHKWFCSAPMSDAFLMLAQAPRGLSCFLLPRFTPDEKRNSFFIQRLKNKLGNRSNASGEVEFDGALCWLIGEEGKGVQTIIDMVSTTRLDCTICSAALMRQALVQAIHHSGQRKAFGKLLVEHELMKNVLADLAVESEASLLLSMRLARSYDAASNGDRNEDKFRRIATAVSKYFICKRAPSQIYEALECLGGNGYVEESMMPRLFRESPVNSVWEGSGNVICLDVLRAIRNEPEVLDAFFGEVELACGSDRALDTRIKKLKDRISSEVEERDARHLVESMAIVLEASLMVRHSTKPMADAFLNSRLGEDRRLFFGTLPAGADLAQILERSAPR